VRRKTYIKQKEDCISLNHTEIRVEKWAQVRHVLTHTGAIYAEEGFEFKKILVTLFCHMGTCEPTEQNLGARQKKRERTHPVGLTTKAQQRNNTACQQRRGRKVTNQQQKTQVSTKSE
jgi:hypothetical protein